MATSFPSFPSFTRLARFAPILSIPFFVLACVADATTGQGYASPSEGESGGSTPSSPSDSSPSEHPILALVDTNQTMTAAPGQGVGVFTEYDSGGQWRVWWTCDSDVDTTNPACQFDVTVSVQSGAITSAETQGFEASDHFTQDSKLQIEATTTTSTGMDGFTFTTAPGAVITLTATMGGLYNGAFLFFVEGGKVNDGYNGVVSDPILLQGSMP